jgi:hypothetical protein
MKGFIMPDFVTSIIRLLITTLWGSLAAFLIRLGITVDSTAMVETLTGVAVFGVGALIRLLEAKVPGLGKLLHLGLPAPTYTKPGA